jgi:hypothetical protein
MARYARAPLSSVASSCDAAIVAAKPSAAEKRMDAAGGTPGSSAAMGIAR